MLLLLCTAVLGRLWGPVASRPVEGSLAGTLLAYDPVEAEAMMEKPASVWKQMMQDQDGSNLHVNMVYLNAIFARMYADCRDDECSASVTRRLVGVVRAGSTWQRQLIGCYSAAQFGPLFDAEAHTVIPKDTMNYYRDMIASLRTAQISDRSAAGWSPPPPPNNAVHPFHPNIVINTVQADRGCLPGRSCPKILHFTPRRRREAVQPDAILKPRDDLRVDAIALAVQHLISHLLSTSHLDTPAVCPVYQVLPLGAEGGLIERVPGSSSTAALVGEWHRHMDTVPSIVGGVLCGQLLGLGDRHKQNVLFHRDTHQLLNIDLSHTFHLKKGHSGEFMGAVGANISFSEFEQLYKGLVHENYNVLFDEVAALEDAVSWVTTLQDQAHKGAEELLQRALCHHRGVVIRNAETGRSFAADECFDGFWSRFEYMYRPPGHIENIADLLLQLHPDLSLGRFLEIHQSIPSYLESQTAVQVHQVLLLASFGKSSFLSAYTTLVFSERKRYTPIVMSVASIFDKRSSGLQRTIFEIVKQHLRGDAVSPLFDAHLSLPNPFSKLNKLQYWAPKNAAMTPEKGAYRIVLGSGQPEAVIVLDDSKQYGLLLPVLCDILNRVWSPNEHSQLLYCPPALPLSDQWIMYGASNTEQPLAGLPQEQMDQIRERYDTKAVVLASVLLQLDGAAFNDAVYDTQAEKIVLRTAFKLRRGNDAVYPLQLPDFVAGLYGRDDDLFQEQVVNHPETRRLFCLTYWHSSKLIQALHLVFVGHEFRHDYASFRPQVPTNGYISNLLITDWSGKHRHPHCSRPWTVFQMRLLDAFQRASQPRQ